MQTISCFPGIALETSCSCAGAGVQTEPARPPPGVHREAVCCLPDLPHNDLAAHGQQGVFMCISWVPEGHGCTCRYDSKLHAAAACLPAPCCPSAEKLAPCLPRIVCCKVLCCCCNLPPAAAAAAAPLSDAAPPNCECSTSMSCPSGMSSAGMLILTCCQAYRDGEATHIEFSINNPRADSFWCACRISRALIEQR